MKTLLQENVFLTDVITVTQHEIDPTAWQFDWQKEIRKNNTAVYKLITKGNQHIIQGLLSISDGQDHIFLNLIENAHFNKGQNKIYTGVAGNLFAFACKVAFEKQYDGFVVFDSKTALIEHYQQKLSAKRLGGLRLYIDTSAALQLLNQYYND
ncbi:MAG: hypothetical protein U0Y10_25475 [Spirosomataceae bacterium]